LAGENFGELKAKLHLAKKTLADLSPASIAFSDLTSNWHIKLWQIRSKSPKFSPAKVFRYTVVAKITNYVQSCLLKCSILLSHYLKILKKKLLGHCIEAPKPAPSIPCYNTQIKAIKQLLYNQEALQHIIT